MSHSLKPVSLVGGRVGPDLLGNTMSLFPYINGLHYKKTYSFAEKALLETLELFSVFYKMLISLRLFGYQVGILKAYQAEAPVISVGNLTTGGTGKTPIVYALAEQLSLTHKVAILSRGYGRKDSSSPCIVRDYKAMHVSSPTTCGDEAFMMAQSLENIAVLVGSSRSALANIAVKELGANLLLLDDGFQHIKLKRDLNILLVDAAKVFGNQKILPAGPLREPLSQLSRADLIILTNKSSNASNNTPELLNKLQKPLYQTNLIFKAWKDIYEQKTIKLSKDEKAFVVTAIAQPESFLEQIKLQNLAILGYKFYEDHHAFTQKDIAMIFKEAHALGASSIVTTEKDAVKIAPFLADRPSIPIYSSIVRFDLKCEQLLRDIGFYENTSPKSI